MQDKPMVAVKFELGGNHFQQFIFHVLYGLSGSKAGAVTDAVDVGVDGNGGPAEGGVEHHVGGFAAYAGQGFEGGTVFRHFTIVFFQQNAAGFDHVSALALNRPMVLMYSFTPSTPSSSIAAGVLATG